MKNNLLSEQLVYTGESKTCKEVMARTAQEI